MKVKIFERRDHNGLTNTVNEFLSTTKGIKVKDIKYNCIAVGCNTAQYTAMVIYEETKTKNLTE